MIGFAFGSLRLTPDVFWALSPVEFNQMADARNQSTETDLELKRQLAIMGAWFSANYSRSRRMPSLKKALHGMTPKKISDQEAEELKRQFQDLPDTI